MARRTRIREFTEDDLKSVCNVAKDITTQPEFSTADYEDVRQELLLGLFRGSHKLRSRISDWKTFRWKLLQQLAGKIRRERMQASHHFMNSPTLSLNLPAEGDGFYWDDYPTMMDLVTTEHTLADENEPARTDQLELIVDIRLFVATLPRKYQKTCAAICEHGIVGASRALRIADATLFRRIIEIRKRMVAAGLDEYLQKRPANGESAPQKTPGFLRLNESKSDSTR